MSSRRLSRSAVAAEVASSSPPSAVSTSVVETSSQQQPKGKRRREVSEVEDTPEERNSTAKAGKSSKKVRTAAVVEDIPASAASKPQDDADIDMIDGSPPPPPRVAVAAPAASVRRPLRPFNGEQGEEQRGSIFPAAAAMEGEQSGSDEEYDAKTNVDRSGLYFPLQSVHDEVEDSADPYGSASRRADRVLFQLSSLHLPTKMPGLEMQEAELFELLQRTMDASMNNAALILGPRGSGKSALLDLCLRRLKVEWSKQAKSYVLIQLDGSVQTDDTLAMREIVFQICRDHELEQLKESLDFHAHLAFLVDILNKGLLHGSRTSLAPLRSAECSILSSTSVCSSRALSRPAHLLRAR